LGDKLKFAPNGSFTPKGQEHIFYFWGSVSIHAAPGGQHALSIPYTLLFPLVKVVHAI
jgi:hypothetical protein